MKDKKKVIFYFTKSNFGLKQIKIFLPVANTMELETEKHDSDLDEPGRQTL